MEIFERTKLSVCITTLNRAHYIGATLDSILSQLTEHCEVVIVDGASTDGTEEVISEYTRRYDNVRYFKQCANRGLDRDYDFAVEQARGEYCWLMSDDDLLKPGAVGEVINALADRPSLLAINFERRDRAMRRTLLPRTVPVYEDIHYKTDEMDRLFSDTLWLLTYIGAVVIRRELWMSRDRARYYGSMLIHIGVIFQQKLPNKARLIANPIILYREGNAMTPLSKGFKILMINLRDIVSSMAVSDETKLRFMEQRTRVRPLILYRALGCYSLNDYLRFIAPESKSARYKCAAALIARIPGPLVNLAYLVALTLQPLPTNKFLIFALRASPFYVGKIVWGRWFRRRAAPLSAGSAAD